MNEIGRKITNKLIELYGSADFSIAFLPYKRSMWNSMASVYEECKASGIDAHCYPIPYLRMKDNGKEVDCMDSDFAMFGDIAEPIETLKQADYIAIHYQYEDHNKVTNMMPEYFTKTLKERYGAKIVYLPYGIGASTGVFAIQPGCRDVDYAFLESKLTAERFIAAWLTQGVDFNGRCFGYGSAKLDVARRLQKVVPNEWAEILENRTVTLICNSLGPFLTNPYKEIDAYERYIIRELYEEHSVIFRPHPLLRSTIRSMRPDMMERYEAFIRAVSNWDYVIVDESEFLERAISAADNLISDPSSVVSMWRETGKPYKMIERG